MPPAATGADRRPALPPPQQPAPAPARGGHGGHGGHGSSGSNGHGGFSSGSEYSRSQYEQSAAGKDSFFARKMEENAGKPDHLPPNQGGKYVGFGSQPAPRAGSKGAGKPTHRGRRAVAGLAVPGRLLHPALAAAAPRSRAQEPGCSRAWQCCGGALARGGRGGLAAAWPWRCLITAAPLCSCRRG
jgi:hypothetical protein